MKLSCSLCNSITRKFEKANNREYVQCTGCKAILLSPKNYLTPQAEKFRYSLHNNDVNDPGYINFVSPVVNQVKFDFSPDSLGLDFGCGTGPVITSELRKSNYKIELYDPFFKPNEKALKNRFDFIICCEVMEHFKNPLKEFQLLRSLLKENGKLYCKTEVWNEAINFREWHYKNDQTHVFFYNKETLEWIQRNLQFSGLEIKESFIIFFA